MTDRPLLVLIITECYINNSLGRPFFVSDHNKLDESMDTYIANT